MKSKSVAVVLAILLGGLGIHHFYLGNTKKGLFYLILWIVFCWSLFVPILLWIIETIEGISLACKSQEDFNVEYNMDNYTINRAYLNQHALQISTHESCLFDVENREEMEKLVTWYNKKYGFREKYAQGLWDNMQRKKLNTFIKRLKFLFGY